ncbi:MAG TPA: 5-methyltetrahydropteroyltriglutamate--homocysteine S-methyltransferase [Bacteroidetes bacterium]|nr:5-methyltetrahydropteroyltriglutamate--homocysteine S-methyltransferase [Bacteroidota bacterium]
MIPQNLGYPRIGAKRELKKACEQYWAGKSDLFNLLQVGKEVRRSNWKIQKDAGIELIPSNDFSYYDQVLDMSLTVGAIPDRYNRILTDHKNNTEFDLYFAMARGYQKDGLDITAMEMTKWFDTNYHYIVPEFYKEQTFMLFSTKITDEYKEAKQLGIKTKPVLIGPVSYLLLGKEKEEGFDRVDLINNLMPVYIDVLRKLVDMGVEWVQFDEPFLALDLSEKEKEAFNYAYTQIKQSFPHLKVMLTTYFEGLRENTALALSLPVYALHVDLVRAPLQLDELLGMVPEHLSLSLGVVDGRNIWKNDFTESLHIIEKAVAKLGSERLLIAPSCSLLHCPFDLDNETDEGILPGKIKSWMAFARQKVKEVVTLAKLVDPVTFPEVENVLTENILAMESRKMSKLIHKPKIKERVASIDDAFSRRKTSFEQRHKKQEEVLNLPLFPTTTIGSFPQTKAVRQLRAKFKKGELTSEQYEQAIKEEIEKVIRWQEQIGLDVLVHGEFERNDMVEYFGEQLDGFAFTQFGWVQSYGSRGVKPPVIFGDVERTHPMTVKWSTYAQSLTEKPVKGMLTGPITILQWSFVRDDQPRETTAYQIAFAIRDEVADLEKAGIKIIQIDEPAIREGLPLRKSDWSDYLQWAVKAFRISSSSVKDETQIHTHMCYSEFNEIIKNIADMDADVITIETSRSQMELLDAFADFHYPNEIGPGVYDIHSPRVPSKEEMTALLEKASHVLTPKQLWVNPDCGLKTRGWHETRDALIQMVEAAKTIRKIALDN